MKLRLKFYLNLRCINFVVLLSYRGPYNYYYGKVTVAISPKSSPSCIIYAPIYTPNTNTYVMYVNIYVIFGSYMSCIRHLCLRNMSYKYVIYPATWTYTLWNVIYEYIMIIMSYTMRIHLVAWQFILGGCYKKEVPILLVRSEEEEKFLYILPSNSPMPRL